MSDNRATIRAAVRASLKGRPRVPESLTRTRVFQADLQQCVVCDGWVRGAQFDIDRGLCADCAAALTRYERTGHDLG